MSEALPVELVARVLDSAPFRYRLVSWSVPGAGLSVHKARAPPTKLTSVDIDRAQFFPNGRWLLSWGADIEEVVIWDVETGRMRHTLQHNPGGVVAAEVFPEGDRVVTCGSGGACTVWCARSGVVVAAFSAEPSPVNVDDFDVGVSVFPSSDRLLLWGVAFFRGIDYGPLVWDIASEKVLCDVNQSRLDVTFGQVFPSGDRIVTGSHYNSTVVIWSAASCAPLLLLSHAHEVRDIALLDGGRALATIFHHLQEAPCTATVWDTATGRVQRTLAHPCLAFDSPRLAAVPFGGRLATMTRSGGVVWDAMSGEALVRLPGFDVEDVVVSPAGDVIAVCDVGRVVVFDVASGATLRVFDAGVRRSEAPPSHAAQARRRMRGGVSACGVAIGIGTALDPDGIGRGVFWRDLTRVRTTQPVMTLDGRRGVYRA